MIRKTFNYLSKPAKNSYTLGELLLSFTAPMEYYSGDDFSNRAGRFTERSVTIGTFVGSIATGAAAGFAPIIGMLVISKIAGLIAGVIAGSVVTKINDALENAADITNKKEETPAEPEQDAKAKPAASAPAAPSA